MKLLASLIVLILLAFVVIGGPATTASAAVNCTVRNNIRVDINNLDTHELLSSPGAIVNFDPDPRDGIGTRSYVDNGQYDDSNLLGRVREDEACLGSYMVNLTFDVSKLTCSINVNNQVTDNSTGDVVVMFNVDDCIVRSTPTPTATLTPLPTATVSPVSTATPVNTPTPVVIPPTPIVVFVPAPAPSVNVRVDVPAPIVVTAAPVAAPVATVASIRPPSTGDGGLK